MNVVITGASKGIGFELAKVFLQQKDNKVLALSRNIAGLEKLKAESKGTQNLKIVGIDLVNYSSDDLLDEVAYLSEIDILINNAGMLINKPFKQTGIDEWKAVFDINLFAPVKLINDLLPKLEKSKAAHIINIGSMGGIQGSMKFPGLSAYSSSKGAMAILTECLAEELKETAISVNCLCLGAVNTKMFRAAFPQYQAPLESNEIAEFIHDFAIHSNKYINGKVLPISTSTP